VARKKIREYHAKRMVDEAARRVANIDLQTKVALVTKDSNYESLEKGNPWLLTERLVAKPDLCFGKRGVNNLVVLNKDWVEVKQILQQRIGEEVSVAGVTGLLTHWLVEPFIPHTEEYYLSIVTERENTVISFSVEGGIHVEEHWSSVVTANVPVGEPCNDATLAALMQKVPDGRKVPTAHFIRAMFAAFEDLDFCSMEINPFVFDPAGHPRPLDFVGEVDDTALFLNKKKWGDLEFPRPFGRIPYPEEQFVEALDEKTGASLKLTILNETGRIWNLVAGGGASVIFADTVADLGFGHELGNYGEYSGAPNDEEVYLYTRTLLDLATRKPDGRNRSLVIGGGVANFTDVAMTFKGVIHALNEYKDAMHAARMKIFVRRAGPNYLKGLEQMRKFGTDSGLPIEVFGFEKTMTAIVPMAIEWVKQTP